MLKNLTQFEQKILAWSYAGLWVFVTAFLWAPSRDGLEGIYALAFFIPLLLVLPWRKPDPSSYGGWFTATAMLYATWSLATGIWGGDLGYLLLQWVVLAIWLIGVAWVLHNKSLPWDKLLRWLVLVGAVTALVNIAVFYWSQPVSARLEGITVARAPTLVGQVYGLVVLIGILLSWRTDCFRCALGLSLASLPSLSAVLLSQSRGPLLSLFLALVIGLLWLRPGRAILAVQLGSALLALVALLLFFPVEQAWLERGASFRDQIWSDVFRQMVADPQLLLWGLGMSETTDIQIGSVEYHHAHNAWLDIWYRTGLIGLGLAVVHLALLCWSARGNRQLAPLTLWLIYGCACLFVDSRSLFWEIDIKWLLYWVPAGLLAAGLMPKKSLPLRAS